MTWTRTRGRVPVWRCAQAVTAVVVALLGAVAPGVSHAVAASDDLAAPTTARPAGSFGGVDYAQYDGVFAGHTSTGAFRVPYRITAPVDPGDGNGAVVVEPPHFATGLGTLEFQLGRKFLLGRRFVHAGVGYSTTSFGPGLDKRILDPAVPGTYIDGGVADGTGRTDDEIVADFARALATDADAQAMVGQVRDTYLTGFSDSAGVPLRLLASGQADGVFELVLPFTVESPVDPQAALGAGRFDGKLLIVNSATEDSGNLVDSGAHPDQYRFYAVAATPHVSDPLVPLFSNQTTPASWIPALRAHFLQAHRWVRNRVAPPPSSGVDDGPRLPFVELGEAVFHPGFLGSYDHVKTINRLGFATHRAYAKAFNDAVDAYARAGSILPDEASEMMRRASLCPPLTYTETYRDHYGRFVALTPC
jgi:alpha/beta hydrolase family protein